MDKNINSNVDSNIVKNMSTNSDANMNGNSSTNINENIDFNNKITIYTDGACSGNPGPGGWAAVLIYHDIKKEISGGKKLTTNNEMEMTAVYEALKMLKKPCEVMLYSDSAYVVNTFDKGWIYNWAKNDWTKKKIITKKKLNKETNEADIEKVEKREPIKNKELWQEIYSLCKTHKVTFSKVKGHADVELNNRCDELARGEISKINQKD